MSYQLLKSVETCLRDAGLITGFTAKFYRWLDADVKGTADFIVFRMSGTSGPRDQFLQQPDIRILVVGKAKKIDETNAVADAIYAFFAGTETAIGVTKLEPLATVTGPYFMDNERCVFEINVRCFVADSQMAIFDAQGFTFKFNNIVVGGVTRYTTIDGVTPDISHSPIGQSENFYLPGVPQFGAIMLNMYRDFTDPGQIAMESARASSLKVNCSLEFADGTGFTFLGYVKKLPIVGNSNGVGTADAVIKIAGKTVAA
jgi:hypothetical protein